jgi:hypothetical protein
MQHNADILGLFDTVFLPVPHMFAQNHGASYCFSNLEPVKLGRGIDDRPPGDRTPVVN